MVATICVTIRDAPTVERVEAATTPVIAPHIMVLLCTWCSNCRILQHLHAEYNRCMIKSSAKRSFVYTFCTLLCWHLTPRRRNNSSNLSRSTDNCISHPHNKSHWRSVYIVLFNLCLVNTHAKKYQVTTVISPDKTSSNFLEFIFILYTKTKEKKKCLPSLVSDGMISSE